MSAETPGKFILRYGNDEHRIFRANVFNIHGHFGGDTVDVFCFDPPGVPEDAEFSDVEDYLTRVADWCDEHRNPDGCAVIIVPRDRKGHSFQKSVLAAYAFQMRRWEVVRQYTWLTGDTDFHRARYAAQPIWVLRKGNKPMNSEAELRYKDVVRYKDEFASGGMEMSLPYMLVMDLVALVQPRGTKALVCDPFAGSGVLMAVAFARGLRSVSIDIDDTACKAMQERLKGLYAARQA